jgi:hypothetical protein
MRRIFVLLAVLALSSIACADPTADSLCVSSASGDPGDTDVMVLINITNVVDGPIQVIMFNVTYDGGVVELVNAGRGFDLPKDNYGDAAWTTTLGTNKKSVTLAANKKDYALPNGTTGNIAKLYFNVNATAIPGQTSTIGLSDMDIVDIGYVHGTIPVNDGTFTVTGGILGDLNGDDTITSADVAMALQMAVCGEYDTLADVDGDDSVTSLDALMILQVAADRITI